MKFIHFVGYTYPTGSIFYEKEIKNRTSVHWGGFDMMNAEVVVLL